MSTVVHTSFNELFSEGYIFIDVYEMVISHPTPPPPPRAPCLCRVDFKFTLLGANASLTFTASNIEGHSLSCLKRSP